LEKKVIVGLYNNLFSKILEINVLHHVIKLMSYYTIWTSGDGNPATIPITESIINGAWRIRPDGDRLFLEYCSEGKYQELNAVVWDDNSPGDWNFLIDDAGDLGSANQLTFRKGNTVVPLGLGSLVATDQNVVEWRLDVGCNSRFSFQALDSMGNIVLDDFIMGPDPGTYSTSLADLLTCRDYTNKPVSLYLQSLCCLKEHYQITSTYLEGQKGYRTSCGGTLAEWCRCRAISEICCALELLGNLENQLNVDQENSASEPGQGTIDAVQDFFEYLVSAKALVVLNSDLERIQSLDGPGCFSSYGVLRYSNNCCKKMPFFMKPCYVFPDAVV
jgi:hypothetical protein